LIVLHTQSNIPEGRASSQIHVNVFGLDQSHEESAEKT
jgi:hypothetical protein